jgi:phage tail-like protein
MPKPPMLNKLAEFVFDQVGMTHRFVVQIDDSEYDLGSWARAAGLTVNWAKCEYRLGDDNDVAFFPGNASYSNIKLSRAACSDSGTVQKWLAATSQAHVPLSGAIYMVDFAGMPTVTWELKQFFPIAWSIDEFASGGAKPAVETLELAHTGFLHDEARLP